MDKEAIKDYVYKHFSKRLSKGEITIKDVLDGYIEIREHIELMWDGAAKAIEEYKQEKEKNE